MRIDFSLRIRSIFEHSSAAVATNYETTVFYSLIQVQNVQAYIRC